MNPIRFESKDHFVQSLEDRRAFWRKYDELRTKEHKEAEKAWVESARAKMRERMKWSYEDWKGTSRYASTSINLGDFPSCPVLMEHSLDTVLAALNYSRGKSFTVDSQGVWAQAHKLLTWDPYAKTTVC